MLFVLSTTKSMQDQRGDAFSSDHMQTNGKRTFNGGVLSQGIVVQHSVHVEDERDAGSNMQLGNLKPSGVSAISLSVASRSIAGRCSLA